jgi:hypothetical protein
MKLEITDYIASLKEEKELDQLIQDLLREYDFEIVFGPQKGERQYGVDLYAVGDDWEDDIRKVFLVTVKQGDFNRKNWQGSVQAIEPSLREIVTIFIRNNISSEHKDLPIKIIVAHNGINISAIQQNWRAFTESYPQFEFSIWQLETISNLVTNKMVNENAISADARPLLRRIIIYLDRPDYNFTEYVQLLDDLFSHIKRAGTIKKQDIRQLRKINLILSIILSFCKKENDIRLALKATEITVLRFWKFISENEETIDNDYSLEFARATSIRQRVCMDYLERISPVCNVKDGFSKGTHDPVSYTMLVYEHLGFIALGGLEFIQVAELVEKSNLESLTAYKETARVFANALVQLCNNNSIVFNPRADDHIIEWNLVFSLLYKLHRKQDIEKMLFELIKRIGNAKVLLHLAPVFNNNVDEIFSLGTDHKKRQSYDYLSSTLLTTIAEWTVVVNNEQLYHALVKLKETQFDTVELVLWHPDSTTEGIFFIQKALPGTGYTLTGITLPSNFQDLKLSIKNDLSFNCKESAFRLFHHKLWCIGLTACRHYRTYIFPYYWRQFVNDL